MVDRAVCGRVRDDLDLDAFAEALEKGYALLQQAGGHLEACGYEVVSPHNPKAKFIFARPIERVGGDGHTGAQEKPLKQTEDDMFRYVLTWIDRPSGRGWVTHYAPKQAPPPDVECLLAALDLHPMADCPEFNFEPCHWSL